MSKNVCVCGNNLEAETPLVITITACPTKGEGTKHKSKAPVEVREVREIQESREIRENRDNRENRDKREKRENIRENRDIQEVREIREKRENADSSVPTPSKHKHKSRKGVAGTGTEKNESEEAVDQLLYLGPVRRRLSKPTVKSNAAPSYVSAPASAEKGTNKEWEPPASKRKNEKKSRTHESPKRSPRPSKMENKEWPSKKERGVGSYPRMSSAIQAAKSKTDMFCYCDVPSDGDPTPTSSITPIGTAPPTPTSAHTATRTATHTATTITTTIPADPYVARAAPISTATALKLPVLIPRYHGKGCAIEVDIMEKHDRTCSYRKHKNPERIPADDRSGSYEIIGRLVFKTCQHETKTFPGPANEVGSSSGGRNYAQDSAFTTIYSLFNTPLWNPPTDVYPASSKSAKELPDLETYLKRKKVLESLAKSSKSFPNNLYKLVTDIDESVNCVKEEPCHSLTSYDVEELYMCERKTNRSVQISDSCFNTKQRQRRWLDYILPCLHSEESYSSIFLQSGEAANEAAIVDQEDKT